MSQSATRLHFHIIYLGPLWLTALSSKKKLNAVWKLVLARLSNSANSIARPQRSFTVIREPVITIVLGQDAPQYSGYGTICIETRNQYTWFLIKGKKTWVIPVCLYNSFSSLDPPVRCNRRSQGTRKGWLWRLLVLYSSLVHSTFVSLLKISLVNI